MKIEINDHVVTKKIIEVDLPYYYKYDLDIDRGESIIYGKVLENKVYTIQESEDYNYDVKFELEEDSYYDSSFFKPEYESNKDEFNKARTRALEFLNGL